MKTKQILLTITTSKDIADLTDFVAGRAYTIDGVTDVVASEPPAILDAEEVRQQLIDAGWREPVKPLSRLEWMQSESTIHRAVYVESDEYKAYIASRFKDGSKSSSSFEFDGHRWGYVYTGFDDRGEYHLLWRPTARAGAVQGIDTKREDDGYRRVAKIVSSKTLWGSKKKAVVYIDEIPENAYLYAKA